MARRGKQPASAASRSSGRRPGKKSSVTGSKSKEDVIPEVFRDMLVESGPATRYDGPSEGRPLKRRKVGLDGSTLALRKAMPALEDTPEDFHRGDSPDSLFSADEEIVEQIFEEDDPTEESEEDWEEVDLDAEPTVLESAETTKQNDDKAVLTIIPNAGTSVTRTPRRPSRRPLTTAEKQQRLSIHKINLLCLLSHVSYRNHLCNDTQTQSILKRMVPPKVIKQLHVEPRYSQLQRTKAFTESLRQIAELWFQRFKITAVGLRKARWAASLDAVRGYKLPETTEGPIDRIEFRHAARSLEGSADLGAQLLCCLLRSVGVETRLVCSLQPLPLGSSAEPVPSTATPAKQPREDQKRTIYVQDSSDEEQAPETRSAQVVAASRSSNISTNNPQRVTRISQPPPVRNLAPPASRARPKIPRPAHPVYWTEAFNPAHQTWISVDALATQTVGKPSHIEPPLRDPNNTLTYAVAFNNDNTAKDVTARYTRTFNAKVRRARVDPHPGSSTWWARALTAFRRTHRADADADALEDADLARRLAAEGMPAAARDFRGHPVYALERHLRANEVLHPRREVGKVNVGTPRRPRVEPVFRRADVRLCCSADAWFRQGREIKAGESPLRLASVSRRAKRERSPDPFGDGEQDAAEELGRGLYALFQTEVYVPPPVVRGKVPKNAYGNLDVYVPSMVPAGGVHVKHPDAKAAAKILGLDFADAVVGFKFQGRRGTAVTQGVVVAREYRDAMAAVIQGLQTERQDKAEAQRSLEMLRLWKRFLIGLRVTERVKQYQTEFGYDGLDDERDEDDDIRREIDEEMDLADEYQKAGGFVPDHSHPAAKPTVRHYTSAAGKESQSLRDDSMFDFGNIRIPETGEVPEANELNEADTFVFSEAPVQPDDHDDVMADGGGFTMEEPPTLEAPSFDDNDEGGGFLLDDVETTPVATSSNKLSPIVPIEVEKVGRSHGGEGITVLQESLKQKREEGIGGNSVSLGSQLDGAVSEPWVGEAGPRTLDDGNQQDISLNAEDQEDFGVNVEDLVTDSAQDKLDEMLEEAKEELSEGHRPNGESDEDSDYGSLPSHDPEDDDAEPDWLP